MSAFEIPLRSSYDIEDEIKMEKELEKHVPWYVKLRKNTSDKYGYDIRYSRWHFYETETAVDAELKQEGFIELERSSQRWLSGDLPDSYVYYSFLERKLSEFDWIKNEWCGPKDHFEKAVYLKFNYEMDNCFCAPVAHIRRFGEETKFSTGEYNDTYRKLDFGDPGVATGIEESVKFIDGFMRSLGRG